MTNVVESSHSPFDTPSPKPIRTLLVCDQPIIAWGLEKLLQSMHPHLELANSVAGCTEAAPLLVAMPPDVILIDLDGGNGVETIAPLSSLSPARVLALTASRDQSLKDSAVVAGARGVVGKHEPVESLTKAIEKVHHGELWIDRSATGRIFQQLTENRTSQFASADQQRIATLTRRERQTVAEIARDAAASSKLIAHRLNISDNTLRNHLHSIYAKLGLSSRLELFAYAKLHAISGKP